ncbi:MAG: hypothetical protein A3E36_03235 [Candidatus Andersenbacteria bacterium RIFCSPHIGHO2_12_FULL_45_11b]|uniref:DUF4157 domain-containing protein n=1 Tax=Candidatus Andersenbacteria bacterium RIFCSPHIGHO2_12_FULL_45_11b TaxID=1797282 RepID=A0A1G1X993_9BACT|nr:MAG: hypothetical protein A3E36_03235 [Candidatus Andersenbacteria bacterium RIFCSPHIGHO2_12_FULL_45_11b]
MIRLILNLPYSILGSLIALISIPKKISLHKNPGAVIVTVEKLWWRFGYLKNIRATAVGNLVILGPNIEHKDLEHELIHIEQYQRMPIIQPILYYIELLKNGYQNNKYEIEAYRKAGNAYKNNFNI